MTCTQDKLVELAERCERAVGPDRQLDMAIAASLGWTRPWQGMACPPGQLSQIRVPKWTGSLDAAMMLVPAGWDVQLRGHFSAPNDTHLAVLSDRAWLNDAPTGKLVQGDGQTLSLALCIAALRARVQS